MLYSIQNEKNEQLLVSVHSLVMLSEDIPLTNIIE